MPWYTNITGLTSKYDKPSPTVRAKQSTLCTHSMREEFVGLWSSVKANSPKLEFYHSLKTKFGPEKYLSTTKAADARKSLTRFRISAHNLYIERGRYETPLVPRENRWCIYCFHCSGKKPIEDEIHVLTVCPLYSTVRQKLNFSLSDINSLASLFSDENFCPLQSLSLAKLVHSILSINEKYTEYYKGDDFHTNAGDCIIL